MNEWMLLVELKVVLVTLLTLTECTEQCSAETTYQPVQGIQQVMAQPAEHRDFHLALQGLERCLNLPLALAAGSTSAACVTLDATLAKRAIASFSSAGTSSTALLKGTLTWVPYAFSTSQSLPQRTTVDVLWSLGAIDALAVGCHTF